MIQTSEIVKEKQRKNVSRYRHKHDISKGTPITQEYKLKKRQVDCMNLKSFCTANTTTNWQRVQENLTHQTSDREGLTFGIYKELQNPTAIEPNLPINK